MIIRSIVFCISVVASLYAAKGQAMYDAEDLMNKYALPVLWTGVNSAADDYAPSFDPVHGTLCFSSERTEWAAVYSCDPPRSLDVHVDVVPVAGTFNQKGQHRAFVSFAENGEGVGAAFLMHSRRSYMGIVNILRDGGQVNCGRALDVCNGEFFASHPAISPDGTRLVFSSDRGVSRGLDLWMSERTVDRDWTEPVLVNSVVNSEGNEITPVFLSNDSLLYASNGYGGKGGYDIFLSVFRDGMWQEPEPLEWLNSEFDDSDCARMPDGTIIFASNRPGGAGGLDLYVSRRRVQAARQ